MITGKNCIAGEFSANGGVEFKTINPKLNKENPTTFVEVTKKEIERTIFLAMRRSERWRQMKEKQYDEKEIIASFAVKPTSSILNSRDTITKKGRNTKISVKGRHDPCVGIRAVPIGEAMMACVLLDHFLLNRAQCG